MYSIHLSEKTVDTKRGLRQTNKNCFAFFCPFQTAPLWCAQIGKDFRALHLRLTGIHFPRGFSVTWLLLPISPSPCCRFKRQQKKLFTLKKHQPARLEKMYNPNLNLWYISLHVFFSLTVSLSKAQFKNKRNELGEKNTPCAKNLHFAKNLWQNKVCEQFLNKEMIKQFPPSTYTDPCNKHRSEFNSSTQQGPQGLVWKSIVDGKTGGKYVMCFYQNTKQKKHSRKLTYPHQTGSSENHLLNIAFVGDMLVPRRVPFTVMVADFLNSRALHGESGKRRRVVRWHRRYPSFVLKRISDSLYHIIHTYHSIHIYIYIIIYIYTFIPIPLYYNPGCACTKVHQPNSISYQNIQIAPWLCSFLWLSILRESESSLSGCPHWQFFLVNSKSSCNLSHSLCVESLN